MSRCQERTGWRFGGRYSLAFVAVNVEQAEDWNGASGREFIEQRERHEGVLGRLRARLLAAAAIQDGEYVLDVGCSCGETTILAARAAGSGRALGADFSRMQVAEARRLAAAAGVANARFKVADAQVHPFEAGVFDVVLSSFGVMFFDDPAAASATCGRHCGAAGGWRSSAGAPELRTPSLPPGSPTPRRYSACARCLGRMLPSPLPAPAGLARC